MIIIIGIIISFKYAYAVNCNGIPGGCDYCDPWEVNERFGSTLVIPTGDPSCYFVVEFLTRTCYCGPGYVKREIKITGIRKEGNCTNVTDREVFTKVYTFLLFISRDIFDVNYLTFEVNITSPACYQWNGNELEVCGMGCCRRSWVVNYAVRRVEVSSGVTENEVCGGVVQGCRNLCDSLDVLDGALYYPSWPSMCLGQDPCPNQPWEFNPYENYVIVDVQGCRVIAYYEEVQCSDVSVKLRLKFIQLGPNNENIRDGVFITKIVRHILRELKRMRYSQSEFFILISYNCWTRVAGYNYTRVSPCETDNECCVIHYTVLNPPQPILQAKEIINYPDFECLNYCYPKCDTLVDDNLMPLYVPLPRSAITELPENTPIINNKKVRLTYKEDDDILTIYVDGGLFSSEGLYLELYNLLGEKIFEAKPTAQSDQMSIFTIPKPCSLIYFVIIKNGNEVLAKSVKAIIN